MARLLRHRQTKGAETDKPNLRLPRHISTLPPEIFNTDHGSQFTSAEFTSVLKEHGIRISMDGKGCWRDNVFVERLWRTVKYEEVYLKAYDTVSTAKANLATFFNLETSVGRTRRRLWRGGWLGATRQHGRSLQRGATTPDAPPELHSGT